MSRKIAALVYTRRAGSMIRKALLAYFAERANDDGSGIWASKQRIADEIEASRRAVITNIQEMVEEGLLIEVGKRACSNGHTMEYAMNLSAISKLPEADPDDPCKIAHLEQGPVQEVHVTRESPSRQDVNQVHTNRPLTVLEPSISVSGNLKELAEKFWKSSPKKARDRSSKDLVLKALQTVLKKNPTLSGEQLLQGWQAYCRSEDALKEQGKYCKGIDRWLTTGRYESFITSIEQPDLLAQEQLSDLERCFQQFAEFGTWDGMRFGYTLKPTAELADYPPELYARFGVRMPARVQP